MGMVVGLFGDDYVETDGDGLSVDGNLGADESTCGVCDARFATVGHGQGIVDGDFDDDVAGFDGDIHGVRWEWWLSYLAG
jgi:hypothetical protein